ncbi:Xyloglucan endotransglucosylase/hydrolase protein 2-like protein [Drosera capensis]
MPSTVIVYSREIVAVLFITTLLALEVIHGADPFDDNYSIKYGGNEVMKYGADQVTLRLDEYGGREDAASGRKNRLDPLMEESVEREIHDEIDIEFLGDVSGKFVTLQTNIYVNGEGHREERFRLWFDPSADFHQYQILWNQHQIVFYVDGWPIRVFKNNERIQVNYPKQPLRVEASIWDGSAWASHGLHVNWTSGPFDASYQRFSISGCPAQNNDCNAIKPEYFWNYKVSLSPEAWRMMEYIRNKYINYDYCKDRKVWPEPPPECATE